MFQINFALLHNSFNHNFPLKVNYEPNNIYQIYMHTCTKCIFFKHFLRWQNLTFKFFRIFNAKFPKSNGMHTVQYSSTILHQTCMWKKGWNFSREGLSDADEYIYATDPWLVLYYIKKHQLVNALLATGYTSYF